MSHVSRGSLTKLEIIRVAARKFLDEGYSTTSVKSICNELGISTGNLTFYYPTKEHMLAALVELLCAFQRKLIGEETKEGISSVLAVCLELATMVSGSEKNETIRDFFLSTYRSPVTLSIIRENDTRRSKEVFASYCGDWDDDRFAEAEVVVSGIEYAALTPSEDVSAEHRIPAALNSILSIYGVPEELRKAKIDKVLSMDYEALGDRILSEFRVFVDQTYDHELAALTQDIH